MLYWHLGSPLLLLIEEVFYEKLLEHEASVGVHTKLVNIVGASVVDA